MPLLFPQDLFEEGFDFLFQISLPSRFKNTVHSISRSDRTVFSHLIQLAGYARGQGAIYISCGSMSANVPPLHCVGLALSFGLFFMSYAIMLQSCPQSQHLRPGILWRGLTLTRGLQFQPNKLPFSQVMTTWPFARVIAVGRNPRFLSMWLIVSMKSHPTPDLVFIVTFSSLEDAEMRFRMSSKGLASHMVILPFVQSSVSDSRLYYHESFCAWKRTGRMILKCLSFKRSSSFSLLRSAMLLLSMIQFIALYVLCAFLYTIPPFTSPGAGLMAKKNCRTCARFVITRELECA